MMEGIFSMANNNTLLALAYIRESENPFRVFCNLILYCLNSAKNQQLRHDELKGKMKDEFGLNIPNHIINLCVRYLEKSKAIEKLENGAGYVLIENSFNIEQFELYKAKISYNESLLISELIDYVYEKFQITWDREVAYKNLTDLILNEKTATDIIDDTFDVDKPRDVKNIHPTWYVKKYIVDLLEKEGSESYQYFLDIFNGTLALRGMLQTNDYNQDKTQKFKGTKFYFDTKILLRVLGFSLPYLCETTIELVNLITKEYNGQIAVFKHVMSEVQAALRLAECEMKTKGYVENFEIRSFQQIYKYEATDFKIAVDSVEKRLEKEFGFLIVDDIDWNAKETVDYHIDSENLTNYIQQRNPKWRQGTIRNDVKSLLSINIERRGNYSVYFGSKKKLPVLVTSNSKLVYDIKTYAEENNKCDNFMSPWTNNKLPLITDTNLMCRLWLTSKSKDELTLNIVKSAFLFQQSDAAFYEKIKSTYKDVQEKHKCNVIDLDHQRYEKLKESIIEKTKGNLDEIDENVVAISFEEMAERESLEKSKQIDELSDKMDLANKKICEVENNLIKTSAQNQASKFNKLRLFMWKVVNNLPLIIAFAGLVVTYAIDVFISDQLFSSSKIYSLIPVLACAVFEFIDRKLIVDSLMDKLRKKFKGYCTNKFKKEISNRLTEIEKVYEERIIEESIKLINFLNEDNQ